ncbi:MAG: hypothetical protein HY319_30095 [Armatimonadetes bacterium]|nr:hypothetical protein [Armatimonadota bacterium]
MRIRVEYSGLLATGYRTVVSPTGRAGEFQFQHLQRQLERDGQVLARYDDLLAVTYHLESERGDLKDYLHPQIALLHKGRVGGAPDGAAEFPREPHGTTFPLLAGRARLQPFSTCFQSCRQSGMQECRFPEERGDRDGVA